MFLWAESFDYYGTTPNGGRDAMLAGLWSEVTALNVSTPALPEISSEQARSGTHSLKFPGGEFSASGDNGGRARRGLGGEKTTFGFAWAIHCASLPAAAGLVYAAVIAQDGTYLLTLTLAADGAIQLRSGRFDGSVIATSAPVITAQAWHHVEAKITIDPIVGALELRVNNEPELTLVNQNFGSKLAAQVQWGGTEQGSAPPTFYIDDIVTWDDSGTKNNDFFGPVRVLTDFAAADTAVADWSIVGAVNGYEAIDEVPPDADTSYIQSGGAGTRSEFTMPTLPPEIVSIKALYVPTMAKTAAAGTAQLQVSMLSNAQVAAGADRQITDVYTYWADVFESDPNGGGDWSKTSFEAATIRVEKTV